MGVLRAKLTHYANRHANLSVNTINVFGPSQFLINYNPQKVCAIDPVNNLIIYF